ncbi:MAG: serine/threonine-protein kinase, partial [Pyrinomonadaceae bacterium]
MNRCPQCLDSLSATAEVCSKCGYAILNDITETLAIFGLDETQAIKILSDEKMTPEKWQKIKSLFEAAQEIAPEKREKFLKNACGEDSVLKAEVEKLLGSFDEADTFMNKPAVAEAVSMFERKTFAADNKTTGEMKNGKFVAGTILENRYRIIGLLGKGGMGEVFRAEDLKLKQEVALKFLPDNFQKNEAALNRFIGEVRTARQVSHQNVCKVFDIGETNGKHFLSMEFVDGDDLSLLLRRIGRLPSDKAAEISRQICFGLHAIHDAGILHRDLKPANVIIDSRGKARITDFGIAGLEADISKEEIRVGTPAYMSPEQITGKEVTQKSDIYSLGLLLYEIFTGKQAIKADSFDELVEKHKSETPTNPSVFVENIDPIVEKIINRCLEKNPADRPKTALQVALALPGGNPLEAAIAAGETPSPEMVAAAPKKGALKPAVAVACLSAFVLLFAFIVFFAGKVKDHEIVPLEKSPEVLAERAASI